MKVLEKRLQVHKTSARVRLVKIDSLREDGAITLLCLFPLLYSHVELNHLSLDFQDENHLVSQVHAYCLDCDLSLNSMWFG